MHASKITLLLLVSAVVAAITFLPRITSSADTKEDATKEAIRTAQSYLQSWREDNAMEGIDKHMHLSTMLNIAYDGQYQNLPKLEQQYVKELMHVYLVAGATATSYYIAEAKHDTFAATAQPNGRIQVDFMQHHPKLGDTKHGYMLENIDGKWMIVDVGMDGRYVMAFIKDNLELVSVDKPTVTETLEHTVAIGLRLKVNANLARIARDRDK